MARFGWYYEGCAVQDDDDDIWALVGRAIEQAAEDDRLHALLVGEYDDLSPADFFDAEDVVSMSTDGRLSANYIVELIDERLNERVHGGHASLNSDEAKPALRRIVQANRCAEDAAPDIVRWANQYVTLDPSRCCNGRSALPIEFIDGEWIFGGTESEASAVIAYATEPSPETGHVGWVWWALGRMGDAATLREAMAKAIETAQHVIDDRVSVL